MPTFARPRAVRGFYRAHVQRRCETHVTVVQNAIADMLVPSHSFGEARGCDCRSCSCRGRFTVRALLRKHAPIARQMVRKHVEGRIVFTPDRETRRYTYACAR
jgi:hypothetical protein